MAQETTVKQSNPIAAGIGQAISGGMQAFTDIKKLQIQQQLANQQAEQFQLEADKFKQQLVQHDEESKTKARSAWDSIVTSFGSLTPEAQKDYLKIPKNAQMVSEVASKAGYTADPAEAMNYLVAGAKHIAEPLGVVRKAVAELNQMLDDPNVDAKIADGSVAKRMAMREQISRIYGFGFKDQAQNLNEQFDAIDKKLKIINDNKQNALDRQNDLAKAKINKGEGQVNPIQYRLTASEFSKRADVKDAVEAYKGADNGTQLIEMGGDKNEIIGILKMGVASAANKGRPTDKDLEVVSPNPSVFNALKRWRDAKFNNKALSLDAESLKEVFAMMKQVKAQSIYKSAQGFSSSRARTVGMGADEFAQNLLSETGIDFTPPAEKEAAVPDPNKKAGSGGMSAAEFLKKHKKSR